MPDQPLDFEILRRGRRVDEITISADVVNIPALQGVLKGWLQSHGWSEGLWPQFEARVRVAGTNKVRATVVP